MLCRTFVPCSKLALEKVPIIRQELAIYVAEALNHAPSIIIFDDLDSIISTSDSEGSQPSMSVAGLTGFLVDIIDEYGVRNTSLLRSFLVMKFKLKLREFLYSSVKINLSF